jgi:two-component system chemotaxis response regulator CheY
MAIRILVTDDALFMRVTLKNILTQNGFEVVAEASNGAESVALYKEHKPDVVTMDITMPEMDGICALKQIRAHDPSANVVMCTAMGQKNLVVEAIQAGAKDFIVKPFQADRVVEAVRKVAA